MKVAHAAANSTKTSNPDVDAPSLIVSNTDVRPIATPQLMIHRRMHAES